MPLIWLGCIVGLLVVTEGKSCGPRFPSWQQAAWGLPANNGTFACFNQLQFCKRFLWFSKSIKTDICSALTLVRSSTEHKHGKLLVGKKILKFPSPFVCLSENFCYLVRCQLGAEPLGMCLRFFSARWLGAGCSRLSERQNTSIYGDVPLACFTELYLKAEAEAKFKWMGDVTLGSRRVSKCNVSY